MRLLSFGFVAFVIGASGCAAISGLGDYGEGPSDEHLALTSDSSLPPGDESSPAGDDGASMVGDAGSGDDALDPSIDSGDWGDAASYVDARPPCNSQTCPNGCCDSQGQCAGGRSLDTCGTAGQTCKACGSGQACSNGGACVTVVVDSGVTPPPPPVCPGSCQKCGIAESTCCKSDKTCGCAYPFAPCF